MLASTYNIALILAALASYAALRQLVDPRLGGVAAMALWGVVTATSFGITVPESGSTIDHEVLAIVAGGATATMAVFVFGAVTGRLPERTAERAREVMVR